MLTREDERRASRERAIRAFSSQSYEHRILVTFCSNPDDKRTIGELRNAANTKAVLAGAKIIMHWDDDDWSHHDRVACQVAFLQKTMAAAVGYNEMLFWRSLEPGYGEAWRYKDVRDSYVLGTSLCYWSDTWTRKPFQALPAARGGTGEDSQWIRSMDVRASSGIVYQPLLIACIHGGNSMPYAIEEMTARGDNHWKQTPEWDDFARKVMV